MFTLLNHDFMNHEDQFYNLSKSKLTALKKTKADEFQKLLWFIYFLYRRLSAMKLLSKFAALLNLITLK